MTTFWHYEQLYVETQTKIANLLTHYGNAEESNTHLSQVELRNIQLHGFRIKSFALSIIEAALEVGDGRLSMGTLLELAWVQNEASPFLYQLDDVPC